MKKCIHILVLCVLVLSLAVFSFGCNKGDSSGGETQKPMTLIGADMTPATSSTAQMLEWWSKQVEEKTDGVLSFEYYWAGSLIGGFEQLEAVKTGNIQFTAYYSSYHPDIAPLPALALMPLVNIMPLEYALPAVDELFRTHPAIQAEFEQNNVKYLYPVYVPDTYIWSVKKPISEIEDFKGLNFRAFGPWMAFFEALGAAPISMAANEIYDALDRGALDADIMFLPNATGFSYWEVVPYVNTTNIGANLGAPAVMNLDVWNSLTPEVQAIVEQAGKDAVARSIELDREFYARDMKLLEDHGMIMNNFSDDVFEYLKVIAEEKVWNPYIEDLESRGIPGRDVFDTYLSLLEKYTK